LTRSCVAPVGSIWLTGTGEPAMVH
jgi:hypothetical protein